MALQDERAAFAGLGPEDILRAVERLGFRCDGRLLALNSYENRVYRLGIEGGAPLVVKFYRPDRWSDQAILEEHAFCFELEDLDIPVLAPLLDERQRSLHYEAPFRFALYPYRGGRPPDLEDPVLHEQLGRLVARIHNAGALRPFSHRPTLTIQHFGEDACRYLLSSGFIPTDLEVAYRTLAEDLMEGIRACFGRAGEVKLLRLHGDCHPGNILETEQGPLLVDLDDARMGPAIQDLWMFLHGDRGHRTAQLADILEGYSQFREFDARELNLIEALRTLRMMHYAAWLARRWTDPAFPRAFPHFNTHQYWAEHILSLREQAALLTEPPLAWM